MSDVISRQAAIDAYGDWYVEEGTEEGFIGTVKQLLEGLPSAQPEQLSTNLAEVGTDCISRQQAIDAVNSLTYPSSLMDVKRKLIELPPAEPKLLQPWEVLAAQAVLSQPKLGKWIYHIDDLFPAESTMECNQCHAEQPLTCDDEFCPHCGAKMEATE